MGQEWTVKRLDSLTRSSRCRPPRRGAEVADGERCIEQGSAEATVPVVLLDQAVEVELAPLSDLISTSC